MRPGRVAGVSLAAILAGVLAGAACGAAGGALPPRDPCPTPTPAAPTGRSLTQRYYTGIRDAERELRGPTDQFLARWPARKFSRNQEFREELAAAADAARCAAERWRALAPPDQRFTAYDEAVDAILSEYITDMEKGRNAAESRNVSEFRDWLRSVDALPGMLEAAQSNLPTR